MATRQWCDVHSSCFQCTKLLLRSFLAESFERLQFKHHLYYHTSCKYCDQVVTADVHPSFFCRIVALSWSLARWLEVQATQKSATHQRKQHKSAMYTLLQGTHFWTEYTSTSKTIYCNITGRKKCETHHLKPKGTHNCKWYKNVQHKVQAMQHCKEHTSPQQTVHDDQRCKEHSASDTASFPCDPPAPSYVRISAALSYVRTDGWGVDKWEEEEESNRHPSRYWSPVQYGSFGPCCNIL